MTRQLERVECFALALIDMGFFVLDCLRRIYIERGAMTYRRWMRATRDGFWGR